MHVIVLTLARSRARAGEFSLDLVFFQNDGTKSGTNRHELVNTILYRKFVCFNTNFLAFIDLGSKTYIGL